MHDAIDLHKIDTRLYDKKVSYTAGSVSGGFIKRSGVMPVM